MPPSFSAFTRAALPMLAFGASFPTGAAAQAPVTTPSAPEVASTPLAGGASLAGPQTSADAPRLARIVRRDLSLSSGSKVEFDVRALEHPVRVELRVGSTGRKVADADIAAGTIATIHGGALRGEKLRLLVTRTDGGAQANDLEIGTVSRPAPKLRLRPTVASWYGPGLYGNRTACGQTLTRGLRGVAHKSLPCGTTLTVKYRGRSTKATVVDRGPFHGGREFDLTYATAKAIGFSAVGRVYVSG